MAASWVRGWVGTEESDSSMVHWKVQTMSGNRHFDAGEHGKALSCYQQALWLARQQFAGWHDVDEAVAALVVATTIWRICWSPWRGRAGCRPAVPHPRLPACHQPVAGQPRSSARCGPAPHPQHPCRAARLPAQTRQPRRHPPLPRSVPVPDRVRPPTALITINRGDHEPYPASPCLCL